MQMSLVPQHQYNTFRHAVTVEPKDIYTMAADVLKPRWDKHKLIKKVEFTFEEKEGYSGLFCFPMGFSGRDYIIVNLAKTRTMRDLVYTLLHEWRHAWQYKWFGEEYMTSFEKSDTKNSMEVDADDYAFLHELGMKYKNKVINPCAPYSIFVERKKGFL